MKISLNPVTVTYTRTLTFTPTTEAFADWEHYPDQESVVHCAFEELFEIMHDEVAGPKNPMPYTTIKQLNETVVIDWEEL